LTFGKGFVLVPDPWDDAEESMGRVERQARRDQVEEEAGAEQLRLMSRSLTEVAWEAMQQGHRIRLTWSGGETQGVPSAAVDDLVVLPVERGVQAVNLDAVATVEVIDRRASKGSSGDRTLGSFVAFCRMVEGGQVTCHMVGGRSHHGVLVATATDHLYIRTSTGSDTAAARTQVAAISVAGDFPFAL
jgi:hypothetical protein